ncbi:MAG: hypothetical protein EHM81_07925 [Chloroflexi bacterium]|nr:MAG: hypothetical protein EHM81_07925 [Chloroflexota bacterium]
MEGKVTKSLNVLFGLLVVSILFFAGIFLYDIVYVNHAPYPTTPPAPVTDVDIRVQTLESNLDYLQRDLVFRLDQKLYYFGGIALIISGIAVFFGWKTFKDLDTLIREKVQNSLDKALYQLDPLNLRVWLISYDRPVELKGDFILDEKGNPTREKEIIPGNVKEEMEKVNKRVILTGFKPRRLKTLGKNNYDGVTIVPVFDVQMEQDFRDFINDNQEHLNPQYAAFILYTRDHMVSQTKTLDLYANLATANMLPSVASMILTVGRGLTITQIQKQQEKEAETE